MQSSNAMTPIKPWTQDVRGIQVLPIIESDERIIRVIAGPGTGKTFGLIRRVQRILHPQGLGIPGKQVLIVAFNRVIARQLQEDMDRCLERSEHDGCPVIKTVHALCLKMIGDDSRLLLPHEREAMIYDILTDYRDLRQKYPTARLASQAVHDHEARFRTDIQLWNAVQQWLTRHRAKLIGDLPALVLNGLKAGDFQEHTYEQVIVDEFQDLTAAEQELLFQLRTKVGSFLALGDPRQSIYAFRGNDRQGLSKIERLIGEDGEEVADFGMNECQRCPQEVVKAANQLMTLTGSEEMTAGSAASANLHVIVWKNPTEEARGMAKAIVENIRRRAESDTVARHLAMVTRRQFGFKLRDEIKIIAPELNVDLSFSESLLDTWAVREAFLYFCLLVDPDAPTWRAWLGYNSSKDGRNYKAQKRNSDAYLKFLIKCKDRIEIETIEQLANDPTKPQGEGGKSMWERAKRFVDLKGTLRWNGARAIDLLDEVFDFDRWGNAHVDRETAKQDMELLLTKARDVLLELQEANTGDTADELLRQVASRLRYQIATREPFLPTGAPDLQVTTLWGAKGITAEHVYILGLCDEAIPGSRREEYPGTESEYVDEQQRLFYVSVTRSRRTLVLSRARYISIKNAKQLGLNAESTNNGYAKLRMSRFLNLIIDCLPKYQNGEDWSGC